jgi:putative endonuclease
MSNIWHNISPKRIAPEDFICVIEISKGSKKKYELDKETGYIILDRNWHSGHKEIDIVARHEDTIIFVEVKARANVFYGNPQDAVTPRKMHLLVLAADAYLRCNAIDLEVRFDIITITGTLEKPYIKHYESAFRPGVGI